MFLKALRASALALLFLVPGLPAQSIPAPSPTTSGAAQSAWFAFQGDGLLSRTWAIRGELNYRRGDWLERPQQVQPRLSLVYRLNPHYVFLTGYQYSADALFPGSALALKTGGPLQREHRLFEEFSFNHTLVRAHPHGPSLTHRLRAEQRWRDTVSTAAPTVTAYSQRARYLLRTELPLHPPSRLIGLPGYCGISNEVMVNVALPGNARLLNQDRASAFVGWSISPRVTLETAYIHQYMPLSNGITAEHNDILQTSLRVAFALRKASRAK